MGRCFELKGAGKTIFDIAGIWPDVWPENRVSGEACGGKMSLLLNLHSGPCTLVNFFS
jgi:hypothetical protein